MLLTIPQLQAVDFILKAISNEPNISQIIKPVINYDGKFLTGDFVFNSGYSIEEGKINFIGNVSKKSYDCEDSSINQALPQIWNNYTRNIETIFALIRANEFAYFHHELIRLVTNSTTGEELSKLRPYLYNVKSIENNFVLPFIELNKEKLDFVTLFISDKE